MLSAESFVMARPGRAEPPRRCSGAARLVLGVPLAAGIQGQPRATVEPDPGDARRGVRAHVAETLEVKVFDVDGRADQMGRPRYIDERFPTLRALEHDGKGCGGRGQPLPDPLRRLVRDATQSWRVTSRGECVVDRLPILAAAGVVS